MVAFFFLSSLSPFRCSVQRVSYCVSVMVHMPVVVVLLVAWFPRRLKDVDIIANQVLDAGTDLESDHPGFNVIYMYTRVCAFSMDSHRRLQLS